METTSRLSAALLAIALMTVSATAQQTPHPTRPITFVLASGAGSVTDNSARFVAKVLSEKIGQPVVVDNKPGAAGIERQARQKNTHGTKKHDSI
jgi:tripartite-type tricarboxylate transporter receptor subunit TctC